jgi:hypothetical protein
MRVILDTMVWSYIGERREVDAFEALERSRDLTVVVPPSILLEALRTPVDDIRAVIVNAMTRRRGSREHPLPETRLESDELVTEARRLRASWIRPFPNTSRLGPLEAFWTRRLWQQAARDPAKVARVAAATGQDDDVTAKIVSIQRANKEAASKAGFHLTAEEPWADFSEDAPGEVTDGWVGDRIEGWRVESALLFWRELVHVRRRARRYGGDKTYADWIEPWLDLDIATRDRSSWNKFWYYDVRAEAMPRCWIRALMPWAQIAIRVEDSGPRDAQHAAYLFDVDCFVTADRRYARALELVRNWAPRPFAAVALVPATGSIVDAVSEAIPT